MSPSSPKDSVKNIFERAIIIAMLSLLLSALFLSVVNDVYAFVKPKGSVELSLAEPLSLTELSRLLQSKGVIKNPTVFTLFIKSKDRADKLEAFSGSALLQRDMSYREIMLALS